jgi:phage host-nuclease inhibitor protein Gam
MSPKAKTRGANLPVPQSKEEAARAVTRIGELTRELARRQADMNDALARIKEQVEATAEPLRTELKVLTEGLKTWCEANRLMLTEDGKVKSADLGTGLVRWRLRPPKVSLPRDLAALVARLKQMGLTRFVRTIEEPSKEAMLAEPEVARTVTGVRIGSEGEDFVVEPFEAALSEVRP